MHSELISGISPGFPELSRSQGQVAHVLLTRSPLIPRASPGSPFDLHVLSTPPAFVLSQDQTLREILEEKVRVTRTDPDEWPRTGEVAGATVKGIPRSASAGSDPTSCGRTGYVLLGIHVWHAVEFSRFGTHTEEGRFRPASGQPPQPTRGPRTRQIRLLEALRGSRGLGRPAASRPFLSPSRMTLGRGRVSVKSHRCDLPHAAATAAGDGTSGLRRGQVRHASGTGQAPVARQAHHR